MFLHNASLNAIECLALLSDCFMSGSASCSFSVFAVSLVPPSGLLVDCVCSRLLLASHLQPCH